MFHFCYCYPVQCETVCIDCCIHWSIINCLILCWFLFCCQKVFTCQRTDSTRQLKVCCCICIESLLSPGSCEVGLAWVRPICLHIPQLLNWTNIWGVCRASQNLRVIFVLFKPPQKFLLCGRMHYPAQIGHSHETVYMVCNKRHITGTQNSNYKVFFQKKNMWA